MKSFQSYEIVVSVLYLIFFVLLEIIYYSVVKYSWYVYKY